MAGDRVLAGVIALVVLACAAAEARAQGAGRSMDIDTSIRASGMGGASAGVVWGDANVWGNVASLSRVTGLRWEDGRTQLVPGLSDDVWFRSHRLLLGGGGVGVSLMGVPFSNDGVRLDYGLSEQTDTGGNLVSTFSSFETVRGEAAAVSIPRAIEALSHATPGSDAFDVSLGVAGKRTHIELAPSSLSGTASGQTWDWGVQARFSPLLLPSVTRGGGGGLSERMLLDLGFGYSVLNARGDEFTFLNEDAASPATRTHRLGAGVRAALRMPPVHAEGFPTALLAGLDPLVSLGFAFDHDANGAGSGPTTYTVSHTGIELTLANVITLRRGHWTDRDGYIDGPTTGWGLGLPVGPWGGFRYDEGRQPQALDSGLPDLKRTGWTAWCDVVRAWTDWHARKAGSGGGS